MKIAATPIFNADPARLYRPLTKAEYDSIATYSVYNPKSWTDNISATVNSTELFQLPAGPVGFCGHRGTGQAGLQSQARSVGADGLLLRPERQ